MKTEEIKELFEQFEAAASVLEEIECWSARELQKLLGYSKWENFDKVISKAKEACKNAGEDEFNHFPDIRKTIPMPKGAEKEIDDILLTRYACYLIAQNGDSRKPEISFAQNYFAVQTRRAEIIEQRLLEFERVKAREKLSQTEKQLSGILYERGVDNKGFAIIRSKGDQALFRLSTLQLKRKSKMENINDYMPLSNDWNKERLEKLKKLMPDLFTNEGKLNTKELKKLVDPESVNETERYEFRWFGKSKAKREAFTPTDATLIYDEARSVNPAESENLIIEGENLNVLKLLSTGYREKIKCIYIDPPYNTGNDFVYSDKFNQDKKEYWEDAEYTEDGYKIDTNTETDGRFHSNWLNMMYSRLLIARQLLREDGVIFISIDDNEVHHLRKLCDEVFGEDNFYSQIIVRANSRGQTYNQIAKTHEYILVYTKSIDADLLELEKNGDKSDLNLKDKIGNFNIRELRNRNPKFGKHNRPNLFYPIYINPSQADNDGFYPVSLNKTAEYSIEIEPLNSKGEESCWRWGTRKFTDNVNENTLQSNVVAKKKNGGDSYGIYEKYRKTTFKPKSVWEDNAFLTETGTVEIKELGFDGEFDFPKPVELLKRCVELSIENGDIVLDFFAGSGTIGQAVFELNEKKDKNIKFIGIQLPEKCEESSIAFKKGFKKISDITIERNKRVVEKIIEEKKNEQPDLFSGDNASSGSAQEKKDSLKGLGFKVFKLVKSSFPRVEFAPEPEKTEEENIELLKKYIKDKEAQLVSAFNREELITEILIKNGFTLNYKLTKQEEFTKNEILLATDGEKETLICLDVIIHESTVEHFKTHTDQKFICLERALDTTKKWNLKHYMGEKFKAF